MMELKPSAERATVMPPPPTQPCAEAPLLTALWCKDAFEVELKEEKSADDFHRRHCLFCEWVAGLGRSNEDSKCFIMLA